MKLPHKLPIALLLIMVVTLPVFFLSPAIGSINPADSGIFFGVTFGGNTTREAKDLIDKVKGYTNLFIVANWDVDLNETLLNEICQLAVDANLYIMVYFNFIFMNASQLNPSRLSLFTDAGTTPFHIPWLSTANDRWGDKFLGAYILDEPGGKQIDLGHYSGFTTVYSGRNQTTFVNVTNYSDAANRYIRGLDSRYYLGSLFDPNISGSITNTTGRVIPTFTADYALYWFDYLAHYDAVFAELGSNNQEVQNIALCRGAANVQNKQWGAIVTWASNDPPYLASGEQMLNELNTAYSAGAKYLIVFNYPQINEYGALTGEHFQAMESFWNEIHSPRGTVKTGKVALVLPKDYGSGMRKPDDKIWGLWLADDLSPVIYEKMTTLVNQYGLNLDIIYDDPSFNYTQKYQTIYYWNGTTYQAPQPFFSLSTPSLLYTCLVVAAVVVTGVPSYLVIKNKKRTPRQATVQVSTSNATLTSLGQGQLELVDNTIMFHTDKGYLRKHKIIKEIALTDIEAIKRTGNELSITSKGATETFVVEQPYLVEEISYKANQVLEQQLRILRNKERQRNENRKMLNVAFKTVDSLFDILRGLQEKRIDWDTIQAKTELSEKHAGSFIINEVETLNLDFSKLQSAVENNLAKETSIETYELLRSVYEYFGSLAKKNTVADEIHPNYNDMKTAILAYYTLDDVVLGIVVGDKETQKEINQLNTQLEKTPSLTDQRIDIHELEDVLSKLEIEGERDEAVEEIRLAFRQFLSSDSPP